VNIHVRQSFLYRTAAFPSNPRGRHARSRARWTDRPDV